MIPTYYSILSFVSIAGLWFFAIFDPVGKFFGFRYLALSLIVFCTILYFLLWCFKKITYMPKIPNKKYRSIFYYFVVYIPLYGLLVSFLRGGFHRPFIDTSYISAGIYFSCSLIYLSTNKINSIQKIVVYNLRFLCVTIICIFLLLLCTQTFDLLPIKFFSYYQIAFFGIRNYGGLTFYYIYFLASPMILYLLAYESWSFFNKPCIKNIFLLILPVFALFLSGTRMNMFLSIFGVFFIFLWRKYYNRSVFYLLTSVAILICLSFLFKIQVITDMFCIENYSNAKKLKYLESYAIIFSDYKTIFFGQGFNAQIWSETFALLLDSSASKTELTYLEIFRVFGLFGIVFFIFVVYKLLLNAKSLPKEYQWISPTIILYLIETSLNPYLFSSNGMLLFGLFSVIISLEFPEEIQTQTTSESK